MQRPIRRMFVCASLVTGWAVLDAEAQTEPGRKPGIASQEEIFAYQKSVEDALRPWTETRIAVYEKEVRIPDLFAKFKERHKLDIRVSPAVGAGSQPLDLEFEDNVATDVLDFLVEYERADLVVDRKGVLWFSDPVDTPSLAAPGWREAASLRGLDYMLRTDSVPITEPESHAERLALIRQIDSTLVTKDLPLAGALELLSRKTGLTIRLNASGSGDRRLAETPVNQDLPDRPLEKILDALCAAHGLEWFVNYRDVVLALPDVAKKERGKWAQWEKERRARVVAEAELLGHVVRVGGVDLTVPKIAALLERELHVPCRTDLDSWNSEDRRTLREGVRTAGEIIGEITADGRLKAAYRDGILWIVRGDAK